MTYDWLPKDTCHVYIIAHIKGNNPCAPVKIGISGSPEKRFAALQTANPKRLVLLCTFATPHRTIAQAIEGAFHHVMADRRLSGEWFDIQPMHSIELMCSNIRAALNELLDSQESIDFALEFSGLLESEAKLAQWRAYAASKTNDNSDGGSCQ